MNGLNPPTVEFQSKPPHSTLWLVVEHDESHPPAVLMAALEAIGWRSDGLAKAPAVEGREHTTVSKPGTGIFGSWTPDERDVNMAEVRGVLDRLGFSGAIPYRRLRAADLL